VAALRRPLHLRHSWGMSRSIFLVGPMGSGKSAVGRQLARQLGYRFVDSDTVIEQRTGVDIPYIFDREGETGFRVREREAIEELTQLDSIVLATGGGAVLADENRKALSRRGIVVYLQTSVEQQAERTKNSRQRPLLNTADPRAKLEQLMHAREPLYRNVAHVVVTTDRRRVKDVAAEIAARTRDLIAVEPR
jgi:shikimate kinase